MDTRVPFALFVSQAETEALLGSHLRSQGVMIGRSVELTEFVVDAEGVDVMLRSIDGHDEQMRTTYVVGCGGAPSTVRKRAGIALKGDAKLQDFMLADVEAGATRGAALEPDTLHSFGGPAGDRDVLSTQPPPTWRVIAMSGRTVKRPPLNLGLEDRPLAGDLSLAGL